MPPLPTKPRLTKSLALEVLSIARVRSRGGGPPDLPARWLVDLDKMESLGWAGGEMPSGDDVPAWVCRWWMAFSAWAQAGDIGPADLYLPKVLAELLPDLEARVRRRREREDRRRIARWIRARGPLTSDDFCRIVRAIDNVDEAIVYTSATWPLEVPDYTVFVSWRGSATEAEVRGELEGTLPSGLALEVVPWVEEARDRAWAELALSAAVKEIAARWPSLAAARWELSQPLDRTHAGESTRMTTHWIDVGGSEAEMQIEACEETPKSVSIRSVSVTSPDQRREIASIGEWWSYR